MIKPKTGAETIKEIITKYLLEFLVIVLGTSLSFYLENRSTINHMEKLQNEALSKLKSSTYHDIEDHYFNLEEHQNTFKATENILKREEEGYNTNKDSLGFYLLATGKLKTVFVENTEEYNALKNSGLMEVVENDLRVLLPQEKYFRHNFLKEIEVIIGAWSWKLNYIMDTKIEIENKRVIKEQKTYWSYYKIDTSFLTDFQCNLVFSKETLHKFYSATIKKSIKKKLF